MNPENHRLQTLRTLILKSQHETLSDSEATELNSIILSEDGASEAAAMIDQLCAFTDSGALDSLPMKELLSEVLNVDAHASLPASIASRASNYVNHADAQSNTVTRAGSSQSNRFIWYAAVAASYVAVASLAWSIASALPGGGVGPGGGIGPGGGTGLSIAAKSSPRTLQLSSGNPVSSRAQLVSMTACVWQPSGDDLPTLGEPLQSGEFLKLVEGIAELRIGEGTSEEMLVRIEGPASAYIRSDGQLGLLEGAMTARSLGLGMGNATVSTPVGHITVEGQGSVGLIANDSACEFHAFAGLAVVKPHHPTNQMNEVRLDEGEAVRLSLESREDVAVVKFEASEAGFVSARSPGFDSLSLGKKYVDSVLESQPNIYWRFEELSGEAPYQVANLGSTPGMNAVVIGNPSWRQYGDNRVAELGTGTSAAFRASEAWPTEELDEYAIEMWVKPMLFHHGEVLCLHSPKALPDGRYEHGMMFEVTAQHYFTHRLSSSPANRFRFVHRSFGAPQPISVTSLFSDEPYQARVWQHVVAQKKDDRQTLWIDGQLSSARENPVPLRENARILIGQVYPNSSYRRFAGQIDEVAIYDRSLTPAEMRTHIRAAGRKIAMKPAY